MKTTCILCAIVAVVTVFVVPSHAGFYVDAMKNSSSGGTGVETISLTAGQQFSVTVDKKDLWNAGALPRWSNADGLTGDLYATGSDESGESAGTKIGANNYGLWTQGNLSAPYGALVGQIGSGEYFLIGTNYTGTAFAAGVLKLYYWDSNNGDNSNGITANVNAVPLPSALLLFAPGLLGLVAVRRRYRE